MIGVNLADDVCEIPLVQLKEIMSPIERPEIPIPDKIYRQLGVKLWGEGAYERESIEGVQTKYKTLWQVKAKDIVVNKIWARNGSVAVVPEGLSGCYVSGEFPTFNPIQDKLESRWFHWITKTKKFWSLCDAKSQGTSGKNRIRPERFLEIEIQLPPLDEQRRIVARIEELAARIEEARELRRRAVEETEALKISAKNIFSSNYFNELWPIVALGEVVEIRAGVTLGRVLNGPTIKLPYLRVANVQDGYLDLSGIKDVEILESEKGKWQLKKGDILLTEGGDWDKLGRGVVWNEEISNCIHQNHIFRLRVNLNEFDPEYLCAIIGSSYGKEYFQAASKQTTNLASINQRQLKAFKVFKPPLHEQKKIINQLSDRDAKLDALKRHQAETAAALDALLPAVLVRAFRGEV
ncbi:MAG TPA: restriction endonuclease subunit S [Methanothrix sp.]|nr:restriction endonuclease subunit S [Methanothrix sp.]